MDLLSSSSSRRCFSASLVVFRACFVSSFSFSSSFCIFSTRGSYSSSEMLADGGEEGGLEDGDLMPSGELGVNGVELMVSKEAY